MARLIVFLSVAMISISFQFNSCSSQNFDPGLDDKEYLDGIQKRLNEEVTEAHQVLVNQTKVLQLVTRNFIETKIKENLFKAVRVRVEEELEEMTKNNVTKTFRQARQDEDDEDEVTRSTTARPRQGILPQLASVVTTLFGSSVNVTSYVKDATSFLPPDLSNRFVVAASLIDPQRFTSTSTTLPPLVVNGQVINGTAAFGYPSNIGGFVQGGVEVGQPATVGITPTLGAVQQGLIQQQQQVNVNSNSGPVPSSNIPLSQFQTQQSSNTGNIPSSPAFFNQAGQLTLPQQPNFGSDYQTRQQLFQQQQSNPQEQSQQQSINQIGQQQQGNYGAELQSTVNNGAFVPQHQIQYQSVILQPNNLPSDNNNENGLGNTVSDTTLPPTSNEDEDNSSGEGDGGSNSGGKNPLNEEDDSSEVEDDLSDPLDDELIPSDDKMGKQDKTTATTTGRSYLAEYPAIKYAYKLFNRLTDRRTTIPTTTEYTNITMKSVDSLEEIEMVATSPSTATVSRLVQGGVALYEGAREAYQLLQHLNRFLDRVNDRFETAGYGAEEVGVGVIDE